LCYLPCSAGCSTLRLRICLSLITAISSTKNNDPSPSTRSGRVNHRNKVNHYTSSPRHDLNTRAIPPTRRRILPLQLTTRASSSPYMSRLHGMETGRASAWRFSHCQIQQPTEQNKLCLLRVDAPTLPGGKPNESPTDTTDVSIRQLAQMLEVLGLLGDCTVDLA